MKVDLEDFYVMSIMDICDLLYLRDYGEKLCGEVVLSMLRIIMVEWSPFGMIVYYIVMCNDSIILWYRLEIF